MPEPRAATDRRAAVEKRGPAHPPPLSKGAGTRTWNPSPAGSPPLSTARAAPPTPAPAPMPHTPAIGSATRRRSARKRAQQPAPPRRRYRRARSGTTASADVASLLIGLSAQSAEAVDRISRSEEHT